MNDLDIATLVDAIMTHPGRRDVLVRTGTMTAHDLVIVDGDPSATQVQVAQNLEVRDGDRVLILFYPPHGSIVFARLTFHKDTIVSSFGDLYVNPPAEVFFGSTLRQMINLYGTTYGIGIQASTLYFRTNSQFAWHRGGVHDDDSIDPGTGGTLEMFLNSNGVLMLGKTASSGTTAGVEFRPDGYIISGADTAGPQLWLTHISSADVNGGTYASFRRGATAIGSIAQNGTTAVNYNTTSYRGWKCEIEDVDGDEALARVELWRPRTFRWRIDADGFPSEFGEPSGLRVCGFIADEIGEVEPDAVTLGHGTESEHVEWLERMMAAELAGEDFDEVDPFQPDGGDWSVLVPRLTAAVQTLARRNRALTATVADLTARLVAVEAALGI